MKYEFNEDKYIVEALRMFGPLSPPQISEKLSMRSDITDSVKKEICDQFYIQNRCEMMLRTKFIHNSDIRRDSNGNEQWKYYKVQ